MKKQNKVIGLLAVAITLVLVIGMLIFSALMPKKDKLVYVEETVKRGTLTVTATTSGALEYRIASLVSNLGLDKEGLCVEAICVAAGQRVKEGDALIKFSDESVDDVRFVLENAVLEAKASYLQAQHDYELSAMELKTAYDNAKISQEYAADIYADTDQAVNNAITAMDKEITLREDMVSFFKSEVENAQEKYDETQKAYQEAKKKLSAVGTKNVPNYLVLNEAYQKAQNKYFDAQNALEQAEENQAVNQRRIDELETQLADAKARIVIDKLDVEAIYNENTLVGDNAQTVLDAAIADLQKILNKEEALLKEKEQLLADFNVFVGEDGVLYADKGTIVTEVTCGVGDRCTEETTLLTYAEEMNILVNVTQRDVVSLRQNDGVKIRFALHPDKEYEGVIRAIGTTAMEQEASEVCYPVLVSVVGDTSALYSGMEAEVSFVTLQKENALYVSHDAIVEENGRCYVYVQSVSGDYGMREVETGIRCDMGVEILSGLNEGDLIYVLKKEQEVNSVSGNEGDIVEVSSGDVVSAGDTSDRRTDLE